MTQHSSRSDVREVPNIGSAISGGFGRVANRNGAVLALAYMLVGLVWQVAFYSAFIAWLPSDIPTSEVALPAFDAPLALTAAGAFLSLLLLQVLSVVAIRTFVGGHSKSIPSEYYTRRIGFVVANSIVGGLVYGLLVFVGTVFLVVPGIIAYVAFIFTMLYIAVEDENFVAALGESWTLTRGHWLRLFVLLVIVVVGFGTVFGILSFLVSLFVGAAAGQGLGTLVSGVISLPFSLLTLAILAETFTQLRDEADSSVEL